MKNSEKILKKLLHRPPMAYFRITLDLAELPTAGKTPVEPTPENSDGEITFQEWYGNFDENGCFVKGEDYTLEVEYQKIVTFLHRALK